jgi:hypothetical protein
MRGIFLSKSIEKSDTMSINTKKEMEKMHPRCNCHRRSYSDHLVVAPSLLFDFQ